MNYIWVIYGGKGVSHRIWQEDQGSHADQARPTEGQSEMDRTPETAGGGDGKKV